MHRELLDTIIALSSQATDTDNELSAKRKELREGILSGQMSLGDPIKDFCFVHWGEKQGMEERLRALDTQLREDPEVLLINSQTYHPFGRRGGRGCFPEPTWDEEFRRYGRLQGAPDWRTSIKEGVMLPMQHYAWQHGLSYAIGPWHVHKSPIIITPSELGAGKLYPVFDAHLPDAIKMGYRRGWYKGDDSLGQGFELLQGKELAERFALYDELCSFEQKLGREHPTGYPGVSREARLVANEGLSHAEFKKRQAEDLLAHQQETLRRLAGAVYGREREERVIDAVREAIAAGLDRAELAIEYEPGVAVAAPRFVQEHARRYGP